MRKVIVLCTFSILLAPIPLLAAGLDDLATVLDRTSHRSSSHDRTGGNIDNVTSFAPGDVHTVLDTDGPGRITHVWFTVARFPNHPTFLRDLVIRMYWEGSSVPSVDVPLGDFFALGHGTAYKVRSAPIAVGDNAKALNCYWPMPFNRHARIEIVNNGDRSIRRIYYNIDYELGPIPEGQGLFHAEFRRDRELRTQAHAGNVTGADNYVILETTGRGQYVGCALFVDAQPGGWWGEGDEMIFIDHSDRPVMIGTGSEDYFCNAWGYREAFSYPYYGAPFLKKGDDGGSYTTVYRWHIPDPVRFREHIRVTIEHLFSPKVVNDYSSVAYWYQTEPIARRKSLPQGKQNHPRSVPKVERPPKFEMDSTELEESLRARGIKARAITANIHDGYHNGGWLRLEAGSEPIEVRIPVPEDGSYHVQVKPVNHLIEQSITLSLQGGSTAQVPKREGHEHRIPYADLGSARAEGGNLTLTVSGQNVIGLDHLKVEKVGG